MYGLIILYGGDRPIDPMSDEVVLTSADIEDFQDEFRECYPDEIGVIVKMEEVGRLRAVHDIQFVKTGE